MRRPGSCFALPAIRRLAVAILPLLAMPSPAPALAADDCIVLEDFAKSAVGGFPAGWRVRKDDAQKDYTVQEEDGRRFLRARSEGRGVQAAKQVEWNLDEYPVLAWRWRPREFPTGSDERESGRNDSVLSVYLLVPYSTIRGPQAVKYVWSENAPVGTALESNLGLTKVRVLESGRAGVDSWKEERVDVRGDFLAAFSPPATPKPAGVAVLSDSDDTDSRAGGDYADFRACRRQAAP